MKKLLIIIITALSLFLPLFSQSVDSLYGIWEGEDRFVFIEPVETGALVGENKIELVILLKDFYGWYYDRVAEKEQYSYEYPRTRNSATPRKAEHIYLDVQQIDKSHLNNTYELVLSYSTKQKVYIPVVILEDNMFLNFAVQDSENKCFYRGVASSKGILLSEQSLTDNLNSYYLRDDLIYNIRYWITDMEYEDNFVTYKKDGTEFNLDKHIKSANNNYSCVPGRRKIIRNPYEPVPFSEEDFYLSEDKSILLLDSTPYLTKLADKYTFSELMDIVKEANSRHRSEQNPLFPDIEVDFHWDLIDILEKNNEIIQKVRQRQRAFGPRGKDFNK